jgi:hypothetical protein
VAMAAVLKFWRLCFIRQPPLLPRGSSMLPSWVGGAGGRDAANRWAAMVCGGATPP